MADFSAVLRKTIDGLNENTPEMREKVYQKARATVDAKLAAVSPPPSSAVIERQKNLLEDAIQSVESDYAISESTDTPAEGPDFLVTRPEPREQTGAATRETGMAPAASAYLWNEPETSEPLSDEPVEEDRTEQSGPDENSAPPPLAGERPVPRKARKGRTGLVLLLVLVLIVIGGGYALWLNKDSFDGVPNFKQIVALVKGNGDKTPSVESKTPKTKAAGPAATGPADSGADKVTEDQETPPAEEPAQEPAEESSPVDAAVDASKLESKKTSPEENASQEDAQSQTETAMADGGNEEKPSAAAQPANPPSAPEKPEKFTQRLTPEGGEVDDGPSGDKPTIGEGTTVAAATEPPTETTAPATTDGQTNAQQTTEQDKAAQVPVGQKAIFYEERTNSAQGSAENGSIVWSLVQESPGDNLPPEPAIRGEATIPGKNLQVRITIRRNADKSLPASHIAEMIFLTPDDFKGGGIDNVLRIAMKKSEQDTGNPLLGIPAKIADGFFLFALNDTKAEEQTNLLLLRRQEWIDIPIVYKSGRRALMTMEKGVPGDKVFDEALDAWEKASSG